MAIIDVTIKANCNNVMYFILLVYIAIIAARTLFSTYFTKTYDFWLLKEFIHEEVVFVVDILCVNNSMAAAFDKTSLKP